MTVEVAEGSIEEAVSVYRQIPEFQNELVIDAAEMERRLGRRSPLILIGHVDGRCVGFKLGYDRYQDGSWYSWLGGVLPSYRKQGVAEAMLLQQESWVAAHGFAKLYVKSRNRFGAMRAMLAAHGYMVIALDVPELDTSLADSRLVYVKELSPAARERS